MIHQADAALEEAEAKDAAILQVEAEEAGIAPPASPVPVPVSTATPSLLPPPTLVLPLPLATADVRPKITSAATAAISTPQQHSPKP